MALTNPEESQFHCFRISPVLTSLGDKEEKPNGFYKNHPLPLSSDSKWITKTNGGGITYPTHITCIYNAMSLEHLV